MVYEPQAAGVFAEPDAPLGDLMDTVALQAASRGHDGEEILVDAVDGGLDHREFFGRRAPVLGEQVGETRGLHPVRAELDLLGEVFIIEE